MDNMISKINNEISKSWGLIRDLQDVHRTDAQDLILNLWVKLLRNNEAMILLLEKDFVAEALTIYRLSMEHAFNIFAIMDDEQFIDRFFNDSQVNVAKAAECIKRSVLKHTPDALDQESKDKLDEQVENNRTSYIENLGYSLFNASQKSELAPLYDTSYRLMSIKYAHSTYLSVISVADESDLNVVLDNSHAFIKDIAKWSETVISDAKKYTGAMES
ncbi:DUF5677 domain-containing protein [Vibrio owensii]|uniref:DUF5677 domain-containing protein n=1 Tax=Vibrio owensii TaxID=696485 RepID=UPI003AAF76DA